MIQPKHKRSQGVQGPCSPKIFSISCHFVLSETMSQTKYRF